MSEPLIRKVDCVRIPVADLDAALDFYAGKLGHQLKWRSEDAAGLAMPEGDSELVLHLRLKHLEPDLLVESVDEAVSRFVDAGGKLVSGPFEIAIGRAAVVMDPFGNTLSLLDLSKGLLKTDADGRVIEANGR
ncbi:MAG TPA: VOC family protein [Dehalococcoidia bacterium]|nr:VOC family protein [Dehalococcoidia bacterium]